MEIEIKNICNQYCEAILKDGNTTIESGTLDQKENKELAIVFLDAVDDLLCYIKKDTTIQDDIVTELREKLEEL